MGPIKPVKQCAWVCDKDNIRFLFFVDFKFIVNL